MARFNGCPNCLVHFLAQAWHHLEHYGAMHPDNADQVHVITDNLEETASEWLVLLHDKNTPELDNLDTFIQALQE